MHPQDKDATTSSRDRDLATLSPYEKTDFQLLANANEDFRQIWETNNHKLDFHDPETHKTLTKAILQEDFGLPIDLPDDRLCPPIPNRSNYVAWIQRLLDSTAPNLQGGYDPQRQVIGLDIGTGASAIYTLLSLRCRPNWTMCATDIDKKSFDYASRNLAINNMMTRVKLLQTLQDQPLIPLQYLAVEKLDFTICNPPFFLSHADMHASLEGEDRKRKPPAVCTGAEVEMVCEGGDLGFVTRIVNESLVLRDKVTWYSSLFGRMSNAKAIIDLLKKNDINNWAVGCMDQGLTKRWVVAWSFGDMRPANDIARIEGIANEYLPFPTLYKFPIPIQKDLDTAISQLNSQLTSLDLRWTWDPEKKSGVSIAAQNVWNRSYRRLMKKHQQYLANGGDPAMTAQRPDTTALACRIEVDGDSREVLLHWLQGRDVTLWESFCGMLHHALK